MPQLSSCGHAHHPTTNVPGAAGMSEEAPHDEREKSQRRVRRFYEISAQREWERLESPTDGALEFAVHKAWIGRVLPPPGPRGVGLGGGGGRRPPPWGGG